MRLPVPTFDALPAAAVATALALLLPGCLSPAGEETVAPSILPELPARPFARMNAVVDPNGGQGEPSLGVAPDGTLFTHGRSTIDVPGGRTLRGGGTVYRSVDAGATWEAVGTPHEPFPDLDPDLAVDKDGTVWDDILYVGCNSVAVSRDNGDTWTRHPAVCNLPVGDRQYVIPTQGGEAYLYFHQLPSFQQTAMKTTDYGLTWLPTGPMEGVDAHHLLLNGGSGWGGGGFWNEATGSVFATYTWFGGAFVGGDWHPAASVTRDGGTTWEVVMAESAGGDSIGLSLVVGAADTAGNVYLAWAEYAADDDVGVYLAVSTDDGATFSPPKRVDDGTGSHVLPAITTGTTPGSVAVAYYETDEEGYPYDVADSALWNVTLAWTSDALADAPVWERGTLSQTPAKEGPICPDGSGCRGDRQLLDYFQVKRLPDGRIMAIWTSTEAVEDKVVNVVGSTDAAIFP